MAAGGGVGTGIRYALESTWIASPGQFPWATYAINISGAFLLGALLAALVRRGAATTAARNIRLALGTGLLGGYTTYSTFAVEVLGLGGAGHGVLAGVYALGSLAVGAAAAWAGIALARTFTPSQAGPP